MIEAQLRRRLIDDVAVSGMIAERLYPNPLPQNPTLPAADYQLISSIAPVDLEGKESLERPRFQINAWSKSYDEAKALAAAIKTALNGKTWVPADAVDGKRVAAFFAGAGDLYDSDLKLHGVRADYFVWHTA